MTFTRAASNSPLCVPARACLASGLEYNRCRVYNNGYTYPLDQKTFYTVLKDGGYNVGEVGKSDLHKPVFFWGRDGWIDQMGKLGFTHTIDNEGKYDLLWSAFQEPCGPYAQFLMEEGLMDDHCRDYVKRYLDAENSEAAMLPDYAYADNWVADNALRVLKALYKEEKPWMMTVNFPGPHDPWDVTAGMKKRWETVRFPVPAGYQGDPEAVNGVRQNYAAILENIDRNIGRILDQLRADGQYDNTVVIYCSDHGEMLGDCNRYAKSVPHRSSVHIPLIIAGPGVQKNVVRDDLVQLNDLAQTIVDFAGLSMPEAPASLSLKAVTEGMADGLPRKAQFCGLDTSLKDENKTRGYENYAGYLKTKKDSDYIDAYNKRYQLTPGKVDMTSMKKIAPWECVITGEYKLVLFKDGSYQLYDLKRDIWETHNIAEGNEEIIRGLLKEHHPQRPFSYQ